jgi:tetratricopeptide (TPR) repeat protein
VLRYADERRLGVRERLDLFLQVCVPVQFAHERLVVHCDLKPSNIFVTDDGHVKLLDFGVARLIDPDAAGDEVTGLWFTPAYASPEQVRREPPGTASDVYSLGVLLYELLTGHRPYRFASRTHAEVARTVGDQVPSLPSLVVTQPAVQTGSGSREGVAADAIAQARSSTPEDLRRRLRGDLDAIVMRSLAKDPKERYRTAEQLAADIRRHLEHRLLDSVAHTPRYRLTKLMRRHRGVVAAASMVVVSLGVGLAATLWQAARATEAAALAREEAEKAALVASLMTDLFRLSDPNEVLGDTITARDLLDRGTERIRAEFGDQPIVQAQLLTEVAEVYRNLGLYRRAEPLARQALELRTAQVGPTSLEASESMIQLGAVLVDLGRQADAIETLDRAIEIREPLVQQADSQLIRAQTLLAWRVRNAQQHDRAVELFTAALEGQRVLDPDGPEVADLMLGLAATYHDSGMLDEADSLLRTVLADPATSRLSPTAVRALRNVGMIRRVREQYREAEPLLRRALDMGTRLYGMDHIEVYESQKELGLALSGTGAWDEAEELLRNTILSSSSQLGTLHPTTAGLQEALGSLLLGRREYDEAVILLHLTLEEKIHRHQGADHPGVVASLVRMVEALTGAGRFEEAKAYIEQADSMLTRLGLHPSVYSISAERSLGNIAAAEGDPEVAEQHFRRSIELAETLLARPDHRYTLWAKRDFAVFLTSVGRGEEAADILEWVLAAQLDKLGEHHPMVAQTRAALSAARTG